MQGMVVVGLIVEELSNINIKCVKYRSRSLGQGTCQASAMRWSTMQGLVAVGLIFEEIPNINIKYVKVTGVHNIGQGHQVKVPVESVHREEYIRFGGWRPYSWGHMEGWRKRCKSQWSVKYRSRSPSQGTCRVRTLRRSTMQGLMVVGLIVEKILNVDVKCVKGHWSAKYRSRTPGQDTCRVSTYRRSTMQGLVARGLTLEEIWNVDVNYVKVTAAKI